MLKQKIYRIIRNHHDAEDITQESLITAYTHLASFRRLCTCVRDGSILTPA
jgi:DNA-directed RNA polymerase specialized sigma24 family protein